MEYDNDYCDDAVADESFLQPMRKSEKPNIKYIKKGNLKIKIEEIIIIY